MNGRVSGGILQVHPTRLCNLSCLHCYSDSSPLRRGALPAKALADAIRDAAEIGFDVLSLSGGEPLLYEGLGELLDAAGESAFRVNLVSNGILIDHRRYRQHADRFDAVALSLDGLRERHNEVRQSSRSFDQVQAAAAVLRDDGKPFGIIHTLTSESLDELEDLTAMVADWGALLLQIHPFERSGRALTAPGMTALSAHERLIAYVMASALAARHPSLRVQLDLIHRDVAKAHPEALNATPLRQPEALSDLIIEDDGHVVPLTYGLAPQWAVTQLPQRRLRDSYADYVAQRWPALRRRIRSAALSVARGRHGEVAAWYPILRDSAA